MQKKLQGKKMKNNFFLELLKEAEKQADVQLEKEFQEKKKSEEEVKN